MDSITSVEFVVHGDTSENVEHAGSIESAELSSQASLSEAASLSSLDAENEKSLTHKISLINILEMSSSNIFSDADLETEQEDVMSQALSSYKYDRSSRAQKIESAIKVNKDKSLDPPLSPHRNSYTASPSHNASRFCRKPKERAVSEGGSPLHSIKTNNHRDLPCQVSVTSLNANVRLPMDKLSTKLFNPPERSHTTIGVSPRRISYQNGGSCFGGRGRTPRHYVIHPDWVSENFSISKAQIRNRNGQDFIDYMKRSQSCPPTQRNIITWEDKSHNPVKSPNGESG